MVAVQNKLAMQAGRMSFISSLSAAAEAGVFETLPLSAVTAKLRLLNTYWKKFEADHEKLPSSKSDVTVEHKYFTDGSFETTLQQYQAASDGLHTRIADIEAKLPSHGSDLANSSLISSPHHRTALPTITVPKFSGNYQDWRHFHDLFVSLIGENPNLTNVKKMHYLNSCLVGEAARLTSNISITAESFESAWNTIVNQYENKRLLISTQLDKLFSLCAAESSSAKHLKAVLGTAIEAIDALKALKSPTDQWDQILVHLVSHKSDLATLEAWEVSVGATTEFPTFAELRTFLQGRIRAREAMECGVSPRKPQTFKSSSQTKPPPAARVHNLQQAKTETFNISPSSSQSKAPANQVPPSESKQCKLCSQGHFVVYCPQFCAYSPDKRHQWATQRYLCINCLGSHNIAQCHNPKTCAYCQEQHHSMLHDGEASSEADATHLKRLTTSSHLTSSSTKVDINDVKFLSQSAALNSVQINHSHDISRAISRPSVLLATAKAILNYADDNHQIVHLLIDPGSELTLISRTISNNCQLDIISSQIPIVGVGSVSSGSTSGAVNISLTSLHSDDSVIISAHILNKLTAELPAVSIKKHSWNHLNNLQLADPDYFKSDKIDLLIGADCYGQIIKPGVQTGSLGDPVAIKTIFGWSILGPVSSQSQQSPSRSDHIISNDQLHESIIKFWQLEEVPSHLNESLTVEEAECESHFQSTHSRDHTGRYTVRLPFKSSQQLGHSIHIAIKCLNRLIKNVSQKSEFNHLYKDFLTEYEAMGHMQKVPDSYQSSHITYYLPHHGVLREESTTTKLRVVFNGSSNTTSGISLNDTLHTGPKLQSDIFDVLLYVRRHQFIFTTDITKMFRQINVHPDDWDYQRILWVDDDNQPQLYHLTTVTYGTRPAPYLAGRVLKQLIIDEGDKYLLAVEPFEKGSYVDDICRGADNVNHLNNIASQVEAICFAGCFPLAKWKSNHPQFSKLSSSNISNSHEFNESTSKILGLSWKCQPDHLTFTGHTPQKAAITKR
ncbi:uncharacterized protein LOC130667159 [Microplitis mediator]|uniref:uncharacterized protein LOC130667159 n=1 Tax=Microplitis mediator TaxID=375433 RepID=UPI0025555C24|nr:uncharacterized protein LOC130667159 [Microplitis mediator]